MAQLTFYENELVYKNGYHRIHCDCGNEMFVWPNTNLEPCHRVRCYVCKCNTSYTLTGKRGFYSLNQHNNELSIDDCNKLKLSEMLRLSKQIHGGEE